MDCLHEQYALYDLIIIFIYSKLFAFLLLQWRDMIGKNFISKKTKNLRDIISMERKKKILLHDAEVLEWNGKIVCSFFQWMVVYVWIVIDENEND